MIPTKRSVIWQQSNPGAVHAPLQLPVGVVYFLSNGGEYQECYRAEGAMHSLLLLTEKQILAVVTQDMVLTQFSVSIDGQLSQIMTVRQRLFRKCIVHVQIIKDERRILRE